MGKPEKQILLDPKEKGKKYKKIRIPFDTGISLEKAGGMTICLPENKSSHSYPKDWPGNSSIFRSLVFDKDGYLIQR